MFTHSFESSFAPRLGHQWQWFVGSGLALLVLGILAASDLVAATLVATFAIGVAMLAGGVVQLVHAPAVRRWGPVLVWTLSGLLYLAAAVSVLYDRLRSDRADLAARAMPLSLRAAARYNRAGLARARLGWLGPGHRPDVSGNCANRSRLRT